MQMMNRSDLVLVMVFRDRSEPEGPEVTTVPVIGWNDELEPIVLFNGKAVPYVMLSDSPLGKVVDERGVVSLDIVTTNDKLDEDTAAARLRVAKAISKTKEKVNG